MPGQADLRPMYIFFVPRGEAGNEMTLEQGEVFQVLDQDKGHACVQRQAVGSLVNASNPHAEAPTPTIGNVPSPA
jgi:hypothetical protein